MLYDAPPGNTPCVGELLCTVDHVVYRIAAKRRIISRGHANRWALHVVKLRHLIGGALRLSPYGRGRWAKLLLA